jgi:glutamate---cysteine ligase / carboxylate-amine ligase
VGVEEELMILDAASYAPVPAAAELVADAEPLELPGLLKTELFASVVELNTGVCGSAREALDALRALRAVAAGLADTRGLRLAAAGSHPFARPQEQEISAEPRYRDFVQYAGSVARRQGVNGLHVHVGMPSGEDCLRALEGVLPWLPLVLALSANSPYLDGVETGLLSNRAEVLGLLPRHGAPPAFRSYDEWERFVDLLVSAGVVENYTTLWWDVRPHPRFGTLEIRMPDQPTSLSVCGALVALLQALAATAAEQAAADTDPAVRGIYEENRWAAGRFGAKARLIDATGERRIEVARLADELLALVRPRAEALGSLELLAPLDATRCEADRQLEVGRTRGLEAVCADLVERSVVSG